MNEYEDETRERALFARRMDVGAPACAALAVDDVFDRIEAHAGRARASALARALTLTSVFAAAAAWFLLMHALPAQPSSSREDFGREESASGSSALVCGASRPLPGADPSPTCAVPPSEESSTLDSSRYAGLGISSDPTLSQTFSPAMMSARTGESLSCRDQVTLALVRP